jgi:hypothetical protein
MIVLAQVQDTTYETRVFQMEFLLDHGQKPSNLARPFPHPIHERVGML